MNAVHLVYFSWLLLLLAAAVWIFFSVKRTKGAWTPGVAQDKSMEYLEKQNQLMEQYIKVAERIATALENMGRRPQPE